MTLAFDGGFIYCHLLVTRSENDARAELHQRTEDLKEKLWEISDARKEEADQERVAIMDDRWVVDHAVILTNSYITLMQAEMDRYLGTRQVVYDFQRDSNDAPLSDPPHLLLGPKLPLSHTLESVDLNLPGHVNVVDHSQQKQQQQQQQPQSQGGKKGQSGAAGQQSTSSAGGATSANSASGGAKKADKASASAPNGGTAAAGTSKKQAIDSAALSAASGSAPSVSNPATSANPQPVVDPPIENDPLYADIYTAFNAAIITATAEESNLTEANVKDKKDRKKAAPNEPSADNKGKVDTPFKSLFGHIVI